MANWKSTLRIGAKSTPAISPRKADVSTKLPTKPEVAQNTSDGISKVAANVPKLADDAGHDPALKAQDGDALPEAPKHASGFDQAATPSPHHGDEG
jgi:hypothetical protein